MSNLDENLAGAAPLQVALDTQVTLELLDAAGNSEEMALQIVRPEASDMDKGRLGADTPLARAILGKPAGATVAYAMGDISHLRIVSVMPAVACFVVMSITTEVAIFLI